MRIKQVPCLSIGIARDIPAAILDDAVTDGKPSPVPLPTSLVVKNGSKILSGNLLGMPIPVSQTSTNHIPAAWLWFSA